MHHLASESLQMLEVCVGLQVLNLLDTIGDQASGALIC